MQSQMRRPCLPAAGYHRIKKLQCTFCDVIPCNERKSRIEDRFPHCFRGLQMTDVGRPSPRHRKYNGPGSTLDDIVQCEPPADLENPLYSFVQLRFLDDVHRNVLGPRTIECFIGEEQV